MLCLVVLRRVVWCCTCVVLCCHVLCRIALVLCRVLLVLSQVVSCYVCSCGFLDCIVWTKAVNVGWKFKHVFTMVSWSMGAFCRVTMTVPTIKKFQTEAMYVLTKSFSEVFLQDQQGMNGFSLKNLLFVKPQLQ